MPIGRPRNMPGRVSLTALILMLEVTLQTLETIWCFSPKEFVFLESILLQPKLLSEAAVLR